MYADVEDALFRIDNRLEKLEKDRKVEIGRDCTKIVSKIDPRIHKSDTLLTNKKTSENAFFTYIFDTLVSKIEKLESRIDQLES